MHAVSQAISLARATWQSRGLPCAGQLACVPDNREGYHLLASSLAKLMRKLIRKSIPNRSWELPGAAPEHPKSTQNRSRDPLGTPPWRPRAFGRHPGSVLEASRGAPGTPRDRPEGPQERPGTPGGASGSTRERSGAAKIDAKSRPGAQKSIFFRAARSRSVVIAIFRRFLSIFGFFVKSANPPKVSRLSAKSKVRPFALRVTSLAR